MYKKFFIVTALMLALAAGLAVAGTQGTNSPKGHHGNWMLQRMTRELNLTEAQQTQIKSILQTERAKTQPIREQMRQNRQSRTSSTTPGTFDENATRTYATKQAQLMSNLMVERERTKSQIFAVLTPDQQQKAQQLMQQHKERRHHRQPGTAQPQAQQSPS